MTNKNTTTNEKVFLESAFTSKGVVALIVCHTKTSWEKSQGVFCLVVKQWKRLVNVSKLSKYTRGFDHSSLGYKGNLMRTMGDSYQQLPNTSFGLELGSNGYTLSIQRASKRT